MYNFNCEGKSMDYEGFLDTKRQLGGDYGFKPNFMPDYLFDFQSSLVYWSINKGKSAIFADCGLGKTPMQLVWAENIHRHTNKPVLVLTPLAVSHQTVTESEKFDIEAGRSHQGEITKGIMVTNYERLHMFNPDDFGGVVCDESSILKSFNGQRRKEITEFMRRAKYRLLTTATAAPNDYFELGSSSEALGELGYIDMLNRFFKNNQNNSATGRMYGNVIKWRFKGHAEEQFWRWVSSWARACRTPSDLGFDDDRFTLPPMVEEEHIIQATRKAEGFLFDVPAIGLAEQREEQRRTVQERCEKVAELVDTKEPALVWCHFNSEGDLLEKLIPDSIQVSGKDNDDQKEEKFKRFASGEARVLVTKPKIGAWGLNFQHCNHITFFPSHSFEQYYQGVRRCWRFGQERTVKVDIVTTEGGAGIMKNLQRKAVAADNMFDSLVSHMNDSLNIETGINFDSSQEVPSWL